ncbi:hypothetical protein SDC9_208772 [bioreactor metagenome]|uniref:Uncharacterized protein n=1 Tax=bioreactor metagenome TaxID=1076179 RepID=A0A645JBH2_9ZZZZ
MAVVGRFRRETRPEERNQRRAGVGEVVHRIGGNRDAAGQDADRQLDREQQQVADQSDGAAEDAAGLAHPLVGSPGGVPDKKTNQKPRHNAPLPRRDGNLSRR